MRNGLLHPLSYKSRPAIPPHSGSSATYKYLQTCQQTQRPFKLRILDLNDYFHNHTYSQSETPIQPLRTYQCYGHARDTPRFPLSTTNPTWLFSLHTKCTTIYRVSQEECARLRESVPYVKEYRYNPKHLCPKLNGYGDNGQRSLKIWQLLHTY